MSGFLLSPAAQNDLSQIWDYTAERWGIDQAERYIREILKSCQALADNRLKGVSVEEVRRGYFKLSVGSHFVFYRVTNAGHLDVVRVLHQRMTFPNGCSDPWKAEPDAIPVTLTDSPIRDARAVSRPAGSLSCGLNFSFTDRWVASIG
jgi:toxin ParE1/3/4